MCVRVCVRACSAFGSSDDDDKATVEYGQLDEAPDADLGAAAMLGSSVGGSHRREGSRSVGAVHRLLDWMRGGCGIGDRLPCSRCSARFQVALLSSIGFCISFGIRCNMGLAVLQMTSNTSRWQMAPIVKSMHANLSVEQVRVSEEVYEPFVDAFDSQSSVEPRNRCVDLNCCHRDATLVRSIARSNRTSSIDLTLLHLSPPSSSLRFLVTSFTFHFIHFRKLHELRFAMK